LEIIAMLKRLAADYSKYINYSDVAGIRQLQFINELSGTDVLNGYYNDIKR